MRKRTLAREIALQVLYQLEIRGKEILVPIESPRCNIGGQTGQAELDIFLHNQTAKPEVIEFTRLLLDGILQNQPEIDRLIQKTAQNWEFDRLAILDKNILRLAAYELLFCPDTPPAVSINEAVDLAKKYGSAESGAFVNGILDKISKDKIDKLKR